MKVCITCVTPLCLTAALAAGNAPPDSAPSRYSVTDLGAPDLGFTYGRGVNNRGQVIGVVWGPASVGLIYSGRKAMVLRPLPGQDASDVNAINDSGVVAGNSNVRILVGVKQTRACIWVGGKARDLGMLPGDNMSDASAINASGVVVGSSGYFDMNDPQKMRSRPVMWVNGKIQMLGGIVGDVSDVQAINKSGAILGNRNMGKPGSSAFIYRGGKAVDLPKPARGRSYLAALNDKEQAVGEGDVKNLVSHALLWSGGKLIDLGALPGDKDSSATAINNRGEVVGYSGHSGDVKKEHAFLWRNGHMYNLNEFIPRSSGWVLQMATSINERGQIVGHGTRRGRNGAFLLTPREIR
jgi:probable HAF family extracellular repeat protein